MLGQNFYFYVGPRFIFVLRESFGFPLTRNLYLYIFKNGKIITVIVQKHKTQQNHFPLCSTRKYWQNVCE